MDTSFRNFLKDPKSYTGRFFLRLNSFFSKIETGLLCLIVALMIGLGILEIVLRYGFKTSLLWKTVMLENLTLWLCFLGAALATAEKRHISIDVLSRILSEKIMQYSYYIIDILSMIVVGILAYYGFEFLQEEQKLQATLIGQIPLWWAKSIIPIGFVLIEMHLLLQFGIRLTHSEDKQNDVEGEDE